MGKKRAACAARHICASLRMAATGDVNIVLMEADSNTEAKIIFTEGCAAVVFHALEHSREASESLRRAAERYQRRYGKNDGAPEGDEGDTHL